MYLYISPIFYSHYFVSQDSEHINVKYKIHFENWAEKCSKWNWFRNRTCWSSPTNCRDEPWWGVGCLFFP